MEYVEISDDDVKPISDTRPRNTEAVLWKAERPPGAAQDSTHFSGQAVTQIEHEQVAGSQVSTPKPVKINGRPHTTAFYVDFVDTLQSSFPWKLFAGHYGIS